MNKKIFWQIAGTVIAVGILSAIFLNLPKSTPTTSPEPVTSGQTYTLSQIAQHKDSSSCWTTINGGVYDLTKWIAQHPGGPENILKICGIDGSSAFNDQHGGQGRPEAMLKTFQIGTLSTQ